MSLRSSLGAVRRELLCSLYRRSVQLGSSGSIVSFTFDDFPRTALSVGGPILERFGARGTYYTAAGLMNVANEQGEHFRSEDIDSLLERGHELGSHTFSHVSCRSVSYAEFREDVNKGAVAIEKASGLSSPNFAYPFGAVTLQAKRKLGRELTSARGIVPGFNGPQIDLNLLRANGLYGDVDRAPLAEDLIAKNAKRSTWLIFYTHDVRPNPSPFGCTPALLEAAVSCAARSGCRILTVREALVEAGVRIGNPEGQARQCIPV
ncbi:MAG: polysaccharide deacetylase family protein [Candidatus Sulfotelmatobacter sp.]